MHPRLEKTAFADEIPLDRLLIIGSSGLVGSKIATKSSDYGFEALGTVNTRGSSFPRVTRLDIVDRDATIQLVKETQPKAVINTAALTNVDYCESHKDEAARINVDGVRNLADAARQSTARLVQVSTDFVFDGAFGHYDEQDTPHPLNYYGQTKLDAEKIVSQLPDYAIARPSVVYGWRPPHTADTVSDSLKPMNFAMFVLDRLKRKEIVKAVRDQYSSPTYADNLADALLKLARLSSNGIYHTAGRSCLSRYEFASKLTELFGYPSGMVQPVFSSDFRQLAERPKYSCLRVKKAEDELGMRFLTADEGLTAMRKQSPPSTL